MTGIDWLAAALAIAIIAGAQMTPKGFDEERPRPAQGVTQQGEATLRMGPYAQWRFAGSGELAAEERAIAAKQALRRATLRYELPRNFHPAWLRAAGGGDVWEILYMDTRLFRVTAADARLNGAASAEALARRWRGEVAAALADAPTPMPDGWLAVITRPSGHVAVKDRTLEAAAAEAMPLAVRVKAVDGVLVLEGVIENETQRRRAVAIARQVPGAADVEDRLQVLDAGGGAGR